VERTVQTGSAPLEGAIATVLNALKKGDVVTYGEVAEEAGYPRCARAVGNFLKRNTGFPWWRVVNSKGRLAPGHEARQERLLRQEGVIVERWHVVGMRPR
jgi:methylated-DNA-protein-cysteine methyltransferase-like protein